VEAILAERGQVVIPKAIRDQLGLTPGVLLTFAVEGGKLVIRKKVDDGISRARGIMKLPPGEDLDQWWRDIRGRAPNDPIEPWEELRDDAPVPARIREDHARRRAVWLAEQSPLDSAASAKTQSFAKKTVKSGHVSKPNSRATRGTRAVTDSLTVAPKHKLAKQR
jgi:antitoxin PrlF